MADERGKTKPRALAPAAGDGEVVLTLSESQLARQQLRGRWELASVLNFLKVFQPLLQSNLKVSAEEIETALISPNDVLAQLHVVILKGIPPVNRNLIEEDAWITIACKKLAISWPWVAEGENPLKADRRKEILRYKEELDPVTRLLMLRALCELRAEQDDALKYINDCLKSGSNITTFRKEKIGSADNLVTYWYDGDPVLGHRLHKETINIEVGRNSKGKVHAKELMPVLKWETLATNFEEFQELSETLSSSKIKGEAYTGQTIKNDILPVLEELRKKKERALKKQQREAMLIDAFQYSKRVGPRCSRRENKTVNYTYDEYDRAINEAIQISKRSTPGDTQKDDNKQGGRRLRSETKKSEQGAAWNNEASSAKEKNSDDNEDALGDRSEKKSRLVYVKKVRHNIRLSKDIGNRRLEMDKGFSPCPSQTVSESDNEGDILEDQRNGTVSDSDDEEVNLEDEYSVVSDSEDDIQDDLKKENKPVYEDNVRRSSRLSEGISKGHVETKKRLRQALIQTDDIDYVMLSDSDNSAGIPEDKENDIVSDSEEDPDTSCEKGDH